MYILVQAVYCRPYAYTATGYLLSNKTFTCHNCRELLRAWRWICRRQNASDFFISFSSYFCSPNGVTSLLTYGMSREISCPDYIDLCKDIYEEALMTACSENIVADFKSQFDDYSKTFV